MTEEDRKKVEVPHNAVLKCPMHGGHLRAVEHCESCEHCRGLAPNIMQVHRRPGAPAQPFSAQYLLRCAYPQDRQIFEVMEG